MRYILCLLGLMLCITGCATALDGTQIEKINNDTVEYTLTRNTTPTVVFESGMDGGLNWWSKVYPSIAKQYSAFAYNRPGYGASDPDITPRDGEHVVEELRTILHAKNIAPPYILVGHSLGGLYMQYFTRKYPQEVAALILVDSTHPLQLEGAGAQEKWPLWVKIVFGAITSKTGKAEMRALKTTGQQVMALPVPTNIPIYVLSADIPVDRTFPLSVDADQKRRDIKNLYPGSTQIWVKSGHAVPYDNPDAVISAIQTAMHNYLAKPITAENNLMQRSPK